MGFVHLRVQTEFSLQDSTLKIEDAVNQAKLFGMTHLAITDHDHLYGCFLFEKACREKGIHPIFGINLVVDGYPLILLAETQEGYANLVNLATYANTEGKKNGQPQVSKNVLGGFKKGLIALSGGLSGEFAQNLLHIGEKEARKTLEEYVRLFGNNFFIEISDHGLPQEKEMLRGNLSSSFFGLAEEFGLKFVVTNDVHYLKPEHAYARSVFAKLKEEEPFWESYTEYSDQFYFKSPSEMESLFKDHPDALRQTLEIAKRCEGVSIPRERALPDFPVPNGYTLDSYFEEKCWQGFSKRFPNPEPEYEERLRYEIETIKKMGFSGYFLIVWDFVKHAKESGIPVGPGRGSAAGSLVSYCLEITDRLDPIKHGLLFERFLNPERITMPDIDIDFSQDRRHEMIEYVQQKYGKEKVAQIITFGTMGPKMVIRDIGRILGMSFQETDLLSKEIGDVKSLADAKKLPFFQDKIENDDMVRELFEIGEIVEGLPRHTSIHAAGVVISRLPLTHYVPLQEMDDAIVTQWDMSQLEEIGLLKMDFLGLKTLTIIEQTFKNIEATTGAKMSSRNIPWGDPKTFDLLRKGETSQVFQLESEGMKKTLREMKPATFDDLVALLALYRPGPMQFIPDYIQNKESGIFQVLHPVLEPILRSTHGIMVYQEQIMETAQKLAGYTLGEADLLRRAVSKKKKEILDQERKKFVPRAVSRGVDEKVANQVYDQIVLFSDYGFNKSHAAAYAIIAYDTAYLKANFPVEFMAANLTVAIGDSEKQRSILMETKRMGIEILPPRLGVSKETFTIEKTPKGKAIRFGLLGIRNIGKEFAKALASLPSFSSLEEYLKKIPASLYTKQSWENLIYAGACDHLGHRGELLHSLETLLPLAREHQSLKQRGQLSFFDLMSFYHAEKIPDPPLLKIFKEERRVLEMVLSGHPMESCNDIAPVFSTHSIEEVASDPSLNRREVVVAGVFREVKTILTRTGKKMAFAFLEDSLSEIETVIFPSVYESFHEYLKPFVPVWVSGKVETDPRTQKGKILVSLIRPILTGRQALYVEVGSPQEMKELRDLFLQQQQQINGVSEVIFIMNGKIIPQGFKIRVNSTVLSSILKNRKYQFVAK